MFPPRYGHSKKNVKLKAQSVKLKLKTFLILRFSFVLFALHFTLIFNNYIKSKTTFKFFEFVELLELKLNKLK